jgi:hypothetical protein
MPMIGSSNGVDQGGYSGKVVLRKKRGDHIGKNGT